MVLVWFLSTFPGPPAGATGPAIDYSFAGLIGHAIQPVFAPIGFNWQMVVALIPGFAAREVAVAALGTVYAVASADANVGALGFWRRVASGISSEVDEQDLDDERWNGSILRFRVA